MAFIMCIAALVHGDIVTLMCGIVYWLCIPSCFIFLQIYSMANMNDVSWGTRQAKKDGGAKERSLMDILCCRQSQPTVTDGPPAGDKKEQFKLMFEN